MPVVIICINFQFFFFFNLWQFTAYLCAISDYSLNFNCLNFSKNWENGGVIKLSSSSVVPVKTVLWMWIVQHINDTVSGKMLQTKFKSPPLYWLN